MNRLVPFVSLLLLSACASVPRPSVTSSVPGAAVALPPAPPRGEPPGTTGLSPSSLRATYGEPAFVRQDNGAEIWRYDGPACRAFFFLYVQGAGQTVRHVETLPRGDTIAADAGCLSALRARVRPA